MIVCSIDVCGPGGSFAGKLPGTDHVLRYQTNATSDGNVAGWNGPNVRWNESSGTFTISGSSSDSAGNKTTTTQTLVPEKTASDGKNLSTGIVSSVTTHETAPKNDQTARVVVEQNGLADVNAKTTVTFPEWSGGKSRVYDSPAKARANIDADVRADLRAEGYVVPDASGDGGAGAEDGAAGDGAAGDGVIASGEPAAVDESAGEASGGGGDSSDGDSGSGAGGGEAESGEATSETDAGKSELPVFARAILDLTDQVKTFIDDFFGWLGFDGSDQEALEPAGYSPVSEDEAVD